MSTVRNLAVVFIIIGALLLVGPAFGFSTLAADRTTSVSVADSSNALFGVDGGDETVTQDDPVPVLTLSNNIDHDLDVTVLIDPDDRLNLEGDDGWDDDGFTGIIEVDGETELRATCSPGDGSGPSDIHLELETATGGGITITGLSETITVQRDCPGQDDPGSGDADFTASDVDDDAVQRFTMNVDPLGNGDELSIDLSDPQDAGEIDYTVMSEGEPEVITGSGNVASLEYNSETNKIVYVGQGNQQGSLEIEISNFEVIGEDGGIIFYEDGERTDSDTFKIVGAVVNDGETESNDINTDGDVSIGDESTVNGDIDAGGSVTTGDDSVINNEIVADGDVTIGSGDETVVHGNEDTDREAIEADGDVIVGDDATISNGISSGGDVTVGEGAIIHPNEDSENAAIEADGDVVLEDGSRVSGDIISCGSVTLNGDVTVDGEIIEQC